MINLTYFGSQMSIQMGATTSRADAGAAAYSATITKAINLPSSCSANNINRSQLQSQRQSDNSQPPGASELQPNAKPEGNTCAPGSAVAPASDPSKRMKLSQLDYLANPLRTDHPFGKDLLTTHLHLLLTLSSRLYRLSDFPALGRGTPFSLSSRILTLCSLLFQKSGHLKRWHFSMRAYANLESVLIFLSLW